MNISMLQNTMWITHWQRATHPELRVLCFPHAGGGGSFFWDWGTRLPKGIDLCPVQLPGRERRFSERPHTDLFPLVAEIASALRPYLDVPFALFGHSMGALLSFELTRELRRTGAPLPVHLFLSGHRAPHLPDREPPIHGLPDAEFISEIKELNGTDTALFADRELVELFLPLLRADVTMCERYTCSAESALDLPFTVYGGLSDPDVTVQDLDAWQEHSRRRIKVRVFPGAHFYLTENRDLFFNAFTEDILCVIPSRSPQAG